MTKNQETLSLLFFSVNSWLKDFKKKRIKNSWLREGGRLKTLATAPDACLYFFY